MRGSTLKVRLLSPFLPFLPAILAIVAVGAVLRFWGLGIQSFWNDELSSWYRSHYGSLSEVVEHAKDDIHPPGYHLFVYGVQRFFGDSEFALRIPSAVFGILSILLIGFLGTKLFSHREGILSAAFMAVFWFPIHYSQEARAYSALLLFALATSTCWFFLFRSLRDRGRPAWAWVAGYMVSAFVCAYLHYFGLLLVAFQALGLSVALVKKPKKLWVVALVFVPLAVLYLPWVPILFQSMKSGGVSWIQAPGKGDFLLVLYDFFNRSEVLKHLALLVYLAPVVILVVNRRKKKKQENEITAPSGWDSPVRLLLVWWLVPYLLTFAVSMAGMPVWLPRSLIIVLPPVYLLLARAITFIPIRKVQPWIAALLVVFSLADLLFIKRYYTTPQKQQFREAVQYLARSDIPKERALVVGYVWQKEYLNYYFEKAQSPMRVQQVAGRKKDIPKLVNHIERSKPDFLWLIHANRDPEKSFMEFLEKEFVLQEHKAFLGADVWLYRIGEEK